jgi:hypothetical protein
MNHAGMRQDGLHNLKENKDGNPYRHKHHQLNVFMMKVEQLLMWLLV